MTWSACEVGGADEEVPLLCVHANIFAVSMLDGKPSSEIVMGEGVLPTAVARCDTEGVCSSSVVEVSISMSMSSVFVLTLVIVPFPLAEGGYALLGKKDVGFPFAELENPAVVLLLFAFDC